MFASMGFSWGYLWSPYVIDHMGNPNFEVVPMVHMGDVAEWMADNPALSVMPGGYLLFLNEPDSVYGGDDYRKPDGTLWAKYNYANAFRMSWLAVEEANPEAKWVVGNVYDITGSGRTWLSDFMTAYRDVYGDWPLVAGVGVHNYPGGYDKNDWRNRLLSFRDWLNAQPWGAGKEVWLTEFAMLGSESASLQLIKDQVTQERWLDGQTWISRYAWFVSYSSQMAGSVMQLVNGQYRENSLTVIGQEFAAYR